MSVNRYDFEDYGTYEDDGRYVTYEDYAALEQKLAESQREFRAADATIENLQMQVEKLAAENAGLNEKMDKLATWPGIEFYSSAWEFNNGDGNTALEYMCDTKTPATDAFLAEVRAQGVDMFAAHKRERQQALRSRSMRLSEEAAGMAADAENFADELRKGVQS